MHKTFFLGALAGAFVLGATTLAAFADTTPKRHCATVRAAHPVITIARDDGAVRYAQYSQKACECLLTVSADHLPKTLVDNIKDNHRRGSLLAVGDPKIKGTLVGDRYFAQLESLGNRALKRYDRAMMRQCGSMYPARES